MINNNVSKFLNKVTEYYNKLSIECDDKTSELNGVADQFKYMHSYMHPKHNKKCHCFMRPMAHGYSIVNIDDAGNAVEGNEEAADASEEAEGTQMTPQQIRDLEAIGAVAGDKTTGVARKQINYAYLTLLNKLSKKVKDISSKI